MLGMDQGQRSNAVGFNTAYLPDGEGSRQGGGTYTGQATEPTIQDYENFFGPSARDIKTDLQRFKRHGRWHLPDILQGPNPWLTDRIDGLITDATNSPFTTKILPYRYKEEVDGKIKWNVWSFDEGMASRVPYESAARTLTQSKRSFAGYMVRQGMAIVLEHNFMMTPKGRENFKNQLNQLIGSIQYTNDLDVHMALVLAPSYQKTMRERYYTSDKSPAQTCREFADLFGMMQKNVNALDILIEEGKAILRTWGGPMPDFLLCNSKLTFQMTMTPEKTNYITQGIDGVKRLRQGPDLGSYRGLSIVHSRSFAMELGQQPRDVLRRRVRTAEYYRILPSKKNVSREFEFYNEERDTWFTLSFHDLLKYARHLHDGGPSDNAALVDGIYHRLSAGAAQGPGGLQLGQGLGVPFLGARYEKAQSASGAAIDGLMAAVNTSLRNNAPLTGGFVSPIAANVYTNNGPVWYFRGFTDNLGISVLPPKDNEVWEQFSTFLPGAGAIPRQLTSTVLGVGPLSERMLESLYMTLKGQALNDPLTSGTNVAAPGTGEWFAAYAFYLEIFRRGGLPWGYVASSRGSQALADFDALQFRPLSNAPVDITLQYLPLLNATGSVNHPFHVSPPNAGDGVAAAITGLFGDNYGTCLARRALLTIDILAPLLAKYDYRGQVLTGLDILLAGYVPLQADTQDNVDLGVLQAVYMGTDSSLDFSLTFNKTMKSWIARALAGFNRVNASTSDGELLAIAGISTIPMGFTSQSHMFHRLIVGNQPKLKQLAAMRKNSFGHLSIEMLEFMNTERDALRTQFGMTAINLNNMLTDADNRNGNMVAPIRDNVDTGFNLAVHFLFRVIRERVRTDPFFNIQPALTTVANVEARTCYWQEIFEVRIPNITNEFVAEPAYRMISRMTTGPLNAVVDWNQFFEASSPYPRQSQQPSPADLAHAENVELVIVRPNIEHNMLGVIMGLGGESLGNTLWGQTELSVYDDSMHGIWGMSYKYHERAIVFNEKNLIRMWDIAYDGYNGGKDDTYVNWLDADDDNARYGPRAFKEATLDLTKNYRGPSMVVMAFVHDRSKLDDDGRNVYDQNFRRNWPSPIVFYDTYDRRAGQQQAEALPVDYDNVQTVNVEEFRVFNNMLYDGSYRAYRDMMPEFRTMHMSRKTAGQSSADSETAIDCLAFQGSMRIKEGGAMIQEIQGSGHHGPDYVGMASVRAGKGQKVAGQAPAPYRLV